MNTEEEFNNSVADWIDESELSMEEATFFGSMNEVEMDRAYQIFEENEHQWKVVEGLSFIDTMRRIRPLVEAERAIWNTNKPQIAH